MVGKFSDNPRTTIFDASAITSGTIDASRLPAASGAAQGAESVAHYNLVQQLATDTGWQAASFAANWSDFGPGNAVCQYKKDALGCVCIEGLVKKGVALALPDTIFTLPAGYRPTTQKLFPGSGSGGVFAEIGVTAAGLVQLRAGGSATYTSLTGIRFDPAT